MRLLRSLSIVLATSAVALAGCGGDGGGNGGPDAGGDGSMGEEDAGVAVCPPGECDLAAQDCASPDDGCYFAMPGLADGGTGDGGGTAPVCATAGMGELGEQCMDPNDCEEGLLCFGPTGTMGTCRAVCCMGSDEPCPTGQECLVPFASAGPEDTGVGVCAIPDECDLVDQDCPEAGEGCFPSVKEGVTVCIAAGDLAEGVECEFANDCQTGFACTDGECTRLCDRSVAEEENGCDASQDCVPLLGFPDTVGVCDPPL